jgi:hypothetical protein
MALRTLHLAVCAIALPLPTLSSTPPELSSVFLSPTSPRFATLDVEGWSAEMALMKAVGITSVVTKFSAFNGQHRHADPEPRYPAFYNTSLAWLRKPAHDSVEALLAAADGQNMTVHLGHWEDMAWFNRSYHTLPFLDRIAERTLAVSRELVELYGNHPSLVGLYDPQEPKDVDWRGSPGAEDLTDAVTDRYFSPVWRWAGVHGLLSSTAPFFDKGTHPDETARWWDRVLRRAGPPGTLGRAWLDDDAATEFTEPAGPVPWMRAFRRMVDESAHGVEVWSDCVDHGHSGRPQPMEHFTAQLRDEAPYVDGFTSFEWLRYFSPAAGPSQARFYKAYKAYYASRHPPASRRSPAVALAADLGPADRLRSRRARRTQSSGDTSHAASATESSGGLLLPAVAVLGCAAAAVAVTWAVLRRWPDGDCLRAKKAGGGEEEEEEERDHTQQRVERKNPIAAALGLGGGGDGDEDEEGAEKTRGGPLGLIDRVTKHVDKAREHVEEKERRRAAREKAAQEKKEEEAAKRQDDEEHEAYLKSVHASLNAN